MSIIFVTDEEQMKFLQRAIELDVPTDVIDGDGKVIRGYVRGIERFDHGDGGSYWRVTIDEGSGTTEPSA